MQTHEIEPHDYKQLERVSYNMDGVRGHGTVVGRLPTESVELGRQYVISPDGKKSALLYPQETVNCFEIWMRPERDEPRIRHVRAGNTS